MADERTRRVARAITSCHETGKPRPNYAALARLPDGPGGVLMVTFGAHQATDRADSLDAILVRFRDLAIATHGRGWEILSVADELAEYLPRLATNTAASCLRLAQDLRFLDLLRRSASDPLMRRAQEEVFEERYMQPVVDACDASGFVEPLTIALMYDLEIHGARAATLKRVAPAPERTWVKDVVDVRRANLANAGGRGSFFRNPILRRTTYRMDTFDRLVAAGNWSLELPIAAHGATIRETDIAV